MYESIMRLVPGSILSSSFKLKSYNEYAFALTAILFVTISNICGQNYYPGQSGLGHLVHEYRTAAAVKEITTYCAAPDLTEGA
ncbi:predicted protein [Plenodomus lingam JN3]|uniref:Predicted protein n=1 Tax=Leptosphaeria maculans (strain JN3 / isolate v23.1.3 / race Av1-4-5-6-7-8) TaxID=985895 RepID=E5A8A9_LEPMJ|nr:predicted protein [Plenodomus lingam JN3]CBX99854.1 predicted protein [Plenodomus lingam JN3]